MKLPRYNSGSQEEEFDVNRAENVNFGCIFL